MHWESSVIKKNGTINYTYTEETGADVEIKEGSVVIKGLPPQLSESVKNFNAIGDRPETYKGYKIKYHAVQDGSGGIHVSIMKDGIMLLNTTARELEDGTVVSQPLKSAGGDIDFVMAETHKYIDSLK
jgi:hypothetical protein